jgi:hypothetical protein
MEKYKARCSWRESKSIDSNEELTFLSILRVFLFWALVEGFWLRSIEQTMRAWQLLAVLEYNSLYVRLAGQKAKAKQQGFGLFSHDVASNRRLDDGCTA